MGRSGEVHFPGPGGDPVGPCRPDLPHISEKDIHLVAVIQKVPAPWPDENHRVCSDSLQDRLHGALAGGDPSLHQSGTELDPRCAAPVGCQGSLCPAGDTWTSYRGIHRHHAREGGESFPESFLEVSTPPGTETVVGVPKTR